MNGNRSWGFGGRGKGGGIEPPFPRILSIEEWPISRLTVHARKVSALAGVGVVHSSTHPRAGDSASPVTRQRHSLTGAPDSISAASVQTIDLFVSYKPRDLSVTNHLGGRCRRN
jgi:hypothetical protein